MKKTLFIIILIITNLFCIFAGGPAQFDGMITLTANGEKGIMGNDNGHRIFLLVYGECDIYFNKKICPIKPWEIPVGVNVFYTGGVTGGGPRGNGLTICWLTDALKGKVYIKTKVIKVNRKGNKSYTVETLVNDLLNNIYPHIDTHLKEKYKNTIVKLMTIDTSLQLKQDEEVVIPVMENGFLGSNYFIGSEIVFPSLFKIVRIIADQDVLSESTSAERVYNNLVMISYKNSFSVIKSGKLPRKISGTLYRMPLYYDGAEAKFVVIAAEKWFFVYDLLADKLSGKMVPQFKDVEYADSQSGNLTFTSISSDGSIVSGEARDCGSFEYGLSIPYKPRAISSASEKASKIVCKAYTPARGTSERKAILDGLREWMYKKHKLEVIFVVRSMKVFNGWAWVHTEPQSPDGTSHYEDVSGLIRKKNGDWEVAAIYYVYSECPDCEVDDEKYFKNLMKKYPDVPSCILPRY